MSRARSSPRTLAVERLVRVERDDAYVARLGGDGGDAEAERLAAELVAGVTRRRRYLDFLGAHFTRGDYGALDAVVRQALRVGLYELVERETPPHAAVSESVAAVRALGHRAAVGLVNAVLRAAARAMDEDALPVPDTGKPERDLAVRLSYPTWLVRRWRARFGEAEAEALLRAGNARPTFGLRVNTRRTTPEALGARLTELHVAWRPSDFLDDFLVVERLQPVLRAGLVQDGMCAVQDEAAGLVVRILDPQPGERILDGAAAPGGKALYAAQRMADRGEVVAVDLHEARVGLIREAAEAHGTPIVTAVAADLRRFASAVLPAEASTGSFDRVLLDAPCTGLGVLAKRADLRWQRGPDDLARLAALQDELLAAAARHVRAGGLLVYSTCTLAPEENEERVAAFLARHAGFRLEPVGDLVPASMRTPQGFYLALPHRHGTDGAFAARLRRSG